MSNDNLKNQLTLVFPLFNEADRFYQSFVVIKKFLKSFPKARAIFVNDGSTDETENFVKRTINGVKQCKLISYRQNKGKGFALKRAVLALKTPLVLLTDIDFSTPLSELDLFLPFTHKSADLVIGTRKVKGAVITKHQHWFREWLGRQFTDLTNLCLGMDISDYTCGFKLFKTKAAKKLFRQQKIKRWGFDAEILFLAQKLGYKIVEVPVTWRNDERTKVSLGKDIIRSLWELWQIKWNDWRGEYK